MDKFHCEVILQENHSLYLSNLLKLDIQAVVWLKHYFLSLQHRAINYHAN